MEANIKFSKVRHPRNILSLLCESIICMCGCVCACGRCVNKPVEADLHRGSCLQSTRIKVQRHIHRYAPTTVQTLHIKSLIILHYIK